MPPRQANPAIVSQQIRLQTRLKVIIAAVNQPLGSNNYPWSIPAQAHISFWGHCVESLLVARSNLENINNVSP